MNISPEAKNVLLSIEKYQPVRPNFLVDKLRLSDKTVYKHLANLLENDLIIKTGTNGKSFYSVNQKSSDVSIDTLNTTDLLIEQNYIFVSPSGKMIRGLNGFSEWCKRNNTNYEKQKILYSERLIELGELKKDGLISAKGKILSDSRNEKVILDEIYFSDYYTFDHFGKTKLGQLVYVAKGSQNIDLIKEISRNIKPSILKLIENHEIKAVCFIPPTIDRKTQIMDELEKSLMLELPKINIEKVTSETKVAQKTLRKLEDRIINAQTTMAVDPNQVIPGNVLIIDDATGSGATLNESAKKIKNLSEKDIKVVGYTIVGSFKGFDVISEV